MLHLRIDRNYVFGGIWSDLSGQTTFDARQVSLPVYEAMTDKDVDCVINSVRRG